MKAIEKMKAEKLERQVFETSRELEFFSEKELVMQIGYNEAMWPLALLKELVDNGLDACEVAGIAPEIEITIDKGSFSVKDNGPGLPEATMLKSMDYLVRVSDKAYYVSPTRGQMGNALKAVWAAGFVANGTGIVEVAARGKRHKITVSLDRIAQAPKMIPEVRKDPFVKNGTFVKVHWPDSSGRLNGALDDYFYKRWSVDELIETYAAFNPHSTFKINGKVYERTDPNWQKWRPDDPTSPHWYTPQTLRDLIAAYVAEERRRGEKTKTVRAFVSEFRGLTSTIKQKEITTKYSGVYLQDMVKNDDIDSDFVEKLLADMKAASKPAKPSQLGIIGKEHLTQWMIESGGAAEKSIKYQRTMGTDESGMPYVIEVAFGVQEESDGKERGGRILRTGMNWTPALGDPIPTLSGVIQEMRIDHHDPVTVVVHLARPRFEFVDRGKTRVDW
jgi:DNA topoisomerase VI subunit B